MCAKILFFIEMQKYKPEKRWILQKYKPEQV
jgi:hypothetical protein